MALTDTLHLATHVELVSDSLVWGADTVAAVRDTVPGIMLSAPGRVLEAVPRNSAGSDLSWILLPVILIFVLMMFRLGRDSKFFSRLIEDLAGLRERGNMFDDTVREKSFLVLVNVMCAFSAAIYLYVVLRQAGDIAPQYPPLRGILWCLVATALYCALMPLCYLCAGRLFSDRERTRIWLRGFTASQSLMAMVLLPLSLAALFYPDASVTLLWIATIVAILVKMVFICKGFRIFFTNYAMWVSFLYYLCSLEIIPIMLTYKVAAELCGLE